MTMIWLLSLTTWMYMHSVYASGANTDCLAPPPCTCKDDNIDCFNRDLFQVPWFTASTRAYDSLSLDLSRNHIVYLGGNAFYNLTTTNASDIGIDLSSNRVVEIDSGCFKGMEHSLTGLWMQDNNVSVMPEALKGMSGLQVLNMRNNPVTDFDNGAFQSFGDSLEYLLFGGDSKYPWPTDLQYLTQLKSLQFTGYTGSLIPDHSFLSFKDILTGLTIENTGLFSIPNAVCYLSKLDFLVFTGNPAVHAQYMMPSCCDSLATVTSLELSNNNLDSFPDVFFIFSNIVSLKVTGNSRLSDIDESTFTNISLTSIDLSNNAFTRIPQALGQLTRLPNLYMRQNQITSLDKDQFPQTDLYLLDLSHNPIVDVTDDAFDQVTMLTTLLMDGVSLTQFPKAFKALNKVTQISLWDTQIVCCCDMAWILSEWPYHKMVAISGNCSNINITLDNYISQRLPDCP